MNTISSGLEAFRNFSQTKQYVEYMQEPEKRLLTDLNNIKRIQELINFLEIDVYREFGPGNDKFFQYLPKISGNKLKGRTYEPINVTFDGMISESAGPISLGMNIDLLIAKILYNTRYKTVLRNIASENLSDKFIGNNFNISAPKEIDVIDTRGELLKSGLLNNHWLLDSHTRLENMEKLLSEKNYLHLTLLMNNL